MSLALGATVERVPTAFHWTHGGKEVSLVGSFSKWKEYIPMQQEDGGNVFSYLGLLPVGIHSYKFIVDGEWRFCPDQEQICDMEGNINNCIAITSNYFSSKGEPQSPSPFRKTPTRKSASVLSNHLLLPGVEEVTRHGNRVGKLDGHSRQSSMGNLATYASGFQASSGVKLLLVMVGLPARGKSFISRKLSRYLNWLGYKCRVFNLGSYRRENLGCDHSHEWFRADNVEAMKARQQMAEAALDDVLSWYQAENGSIAIFDGTNSTKSRRELIIDRLQERKTDRLAVKPIFIEIICNDQETIHRNILATKLSSPDYKNFDPESVIKDFTERIRHYENVYETLQREENLRYIKVLNVGRQIVANRITGFVPAKIMFYLSNLHITPRPIYLVRHGQSEYNLDDRIGGDSALTATGLDLAARLKSFITKECSIADKELCVWSSTMKRAVQTSEGIPCVQYIRWRTMEEIQAGVCDGMTYKEIEEKMPQEFIARQEDKLRYRYPRGESYEDVIRRVEPVIIELERQRKPILVVAHRAILRCLYAYFMDDFTREQVPHIPMPLNVVFKLQPGPYGTKEEQFDLMSSQYSV